jgi:hypothetical protein
MAGTKSANSFKSLKSAYATGVGGRNTEEKDNLLTEGDSPPPPSGPIAAAAEDIDNMLDALPSPQKWIGTMLQTTVGWITGRALVGILAGFVLGLVRSMAAYPYANHENFGDNPWSVTPVMAAYRNIASEKMMVALAIAFTMYLRQRANIVPMKNMNTKTWRGVGLFVARALVVFALFLVFQTCGLAIAGAIVGNENFFRGAPRRGFNSDGNYVNATRFAFAEFIASCLPALLLYASYYHRMWIKSERDSDTEKEAKNENFVRALKTFVVYFVAAYWVYPLTGAFLSSSTAIAYPLAVVMNTHHHNSLMTKYPFGGIEGVYQHQSFVLLSVFAPLTGELLMLFVSEFLLA